MPSFAGPHPASCLRNYQVICALLCACLLVLCCVRICLCLGQAQKSRPAPRRLHQRAALLHRRRVHAKRESVGLLAE